MLGQMPSDGEGSQRAQGGRELCDEPLLQDTRGDGRGGTTRDE